MKRKKIFCHVLACFVALALLAPATFVPVHVYAASLSDVSGHWAEPYINSAINKDIATGYSDGTFQPDKPVTRAEFASMMNKALGNTGTVSMTFTDVSSSAWYYSDVSRAVAAAYVSGYDNNSFKPNDPITREEAAVMISRIVPCGGIAGNLSSFGDYGSISDWALPGMQKSNGKGYVGAYDDGNLHPKDKLTRAQTVKIICDIIDKETIVSDAPSVKTDGTTLSEKIYSNGVIIHKDLGENSATIDNCVVMGGLTIQGGGNNSIVISNSRIAECSVAKSSSSVRVVAKGDTCILNTEVSYTARLETSNLTGGDSGAGFSKVNANRSSNLTLSGSFPRINLEGAGSDVKLEAGTINTFEVSSSATDSDITVDSGSTIETVNVNSAVAFHGTGTIRAMNANADNITYEKEPSVINIGSGVTTKPQKVDASLRVTFDPVDGAADVAVNKTITINFSQAIMKYDGKAITGPDLEDLVVFTKESATGADVAFSASISSSDKMITITPDSSLAKDTKYYISFDKNIFKDDLGNGNTAQSISFTVGSGIANSVAFDPAKDAAGVSKSVNPTITFDSAIEKYAGGDITASYLENNIHFRKDSSSGSEVGFSATINSNSNIIMITPASELAPGQKYYLGFGSEVFRTNADDEAIAGQYVTWTVRSAVIQTISFDPAKDAQGVSKAVNPTITFDNAIEKYTGGDITASYLENNIHFRKDSSSGSEVGFSATINSSSKIITVTPDSALTAGQKYYLGFDNNVFRTNADDEAIAGQYVTWTVGGTATTPTISFDPANGATGISASSNITITFSEKIFHNSGSVPSNLNVSSSVTLRDNTAGSNVTYTPYISNSGSGTRFSINPVYYGMIAGHNYTVSVSANSFKNSDGNYAAAASASFTLVTNVDVAALNTAITQANNAKTDVVTSANGSDVHTSVYWVTTAQMTALNNAISTATSALSTVQTTEAANAAAAALDHAVTAFEQAKKPGTKASVDTSAIDQAIKGAELLKKGTVISTDGTDVDLTVQWVTPDIMKALNDAIAKAEAKKATVQTNDEVTAAVLELNWAAVKLFDLKKSYGTKGNIDKSLLADAINEANNLKEATEASDDGTNIPADQYWAPQTELSAFAADIGAAIKILNKTSATKAEVENAISAMSSAIDYFEHSVRKNGLKAGE
jgi:hypothetical protein